MSFWTLDVPGTGGPVTLCDECALMATNLGVGIFLNEEFATMQEAALLFDAMLSTVGSGFPVTSSNTGVCGNCPKRIEVAQ